jgi:hypothetical protein
LRCRDHRSDPLDFAPAANDGRVTMIRFEPRNQVISFFLLLDHRRILPFHREQYRSSLLGAHSLRCSVWILSSNMPGSCCIHKQSEVEVASCRQQQSLGRALAKNAQISTQIGVGKALGRSSRLAVDSLTYKTLGERRSRERWLVRHFHSEYFNIVP